MESFDARRQARAGYTITRIEMPSDVVTKLSPWSMADTLDRLSAVIAARGMSVFAIIDYSGSAKEAGLDLRDTKLVFFGNASFVTGVIETMPLAALDLPSRVVVWADGYQTWVSYPTPAAEAGIDALVSVVIDR